MKRIKKAAALIAVTAPLIALSACQGENSQKTEDKYQDYAVQGILLSPTGALERLEAGDEDILLLDIRPAGIYKTGHIAGSRNVWRTAYSKTSANKKYGGLVADREKVARFLGSLGARGNTLIMLYDGNGGVDATRLWWVLDMHGHSSIALIDGGYIGWTAAGLKTTRAETPPRPETDYSFPEAGSGNLRYAGTEEVAASRGNQNIILLDTRSRAEFTGVRKFAGASDSGHIPWSVWLEHKKIIHAGNLKDQTFRTRAELKEIFESENITPDKEIITFCHISVRGAIMAFALTQLAGYENVKVYDGAWVEWSWYNTQDPDKYPIAKGN